MVTMPLLATRGYSFLCFCTTNLILCGMTELLSLLCGSHRSVIAEKSACSAISPLLLYSRPISRSPVGRARPDNWHRPKDVHKSERVRRGLGLLHSGCDNMRGTAGPDTTDGPGGASDVARPRDAVLVTIHTQKRWRR